MWGLMLSTRVWVRKWGAKEAAIVSPHDLNEVEFTSCKRLCALATD